ncbi:MAG: ornithine cyclodeaminase family protein [Candidatus Limivicinus sp.]|jgi:alanine dehydrogenase
MEFKVLCKDDIKKCLTPEKVMESVEAVYRAKAQGQTVVWPTVFHDFKTGEQDMDIKSGCIETDKVHGLKVINWTAANAPKGLPELVGLILVFDSVTGLPLGLLDAGYITGMRTGCAGAAGAKLLARKDSKKLFVLGTGAQSFFQTAAFIMAFPDLETISVANPRHPEKAAEYSENICARLKNELGIDASYLSFEAACGEQETAEAVACSDMVVTVTPSREPIIKKEWVSPGTHFSCIGADMPGKEEIDPQLFRGASVYCDDVENCSRSGELEIPIEKGIISASDVKGEPGEVLLGKKQGRSSDDEITIFDACGMALLDIETGRLALELAEKAGLGQTVRM